MYKKVNSYILMLLLVSCVDPIPFEVELPKSVNISISGFISDQPGPYQVILNKTFDIKSKSLIREPVSAKQILIVANDGTSEQLTETSQGVYETSTNGIRGKVGGVYKIIVELLDGRIYESVPDTLNPSGSIDRADFSFNRRILSNGLNDYGFDIVADISQRKGSPFYAIGMEATYKTITHPELTDISKSKCYMQDQGVCSFYPPCSGIVNLGTTFFPRYEQVRPCECCTCWYKLFNSGIHLSDNLYNKSSNFFNYKVDRITLDGWVFMFKVHVRVYAKSLTHRSFIFFKAIRDQKDAINSLFQPVSGKIPVNFIQTHGDNAPVEGLFYSTSINSKSFYILRADVPDPALIPSTDPSPPLNLGQISCLDFRPYATSIKPSFWED